MITVEHLSKRYGSTAAVEDVTFSVEEGEILGFLGPNGAGKTTTMRILTGYMPPSQGHVKIAGYDVLAESLRVRQRIGYLPETPPLYPDMTVLGYLDFVARIKGVNAGDRPARLQAALRRCGLADRQTTLIRKLSKGFRQRVGIAQAIVHDPPVIILDEPTVGLDPQQIIQVRNLIKSLAGSHTLVLSTHILPEVEMTCDRVVIIQKGRVVAADTVANLESQRTAGLGYELRVAGDLQSLTTALRQIPGVEQASCTPLDGEMGMVAVYGRPGLDLGPQLASTAVGLGVQLYELRQQRASLEDVFLQLTTEERIMPAAGEEDR
ncbi:MAG: ABC transporter ATP-binding protein [Gloeomargaritaceae cyanobacterium C42_A2020_066]|nr:ABC transporter ATP-binding protein [Gloeomargaritaceae cyanobacterium C42_A2020_066]